MTASVQPPVRPVLVLVGPPGAGKTTVGRLVAARLGTVFRDTDDDVVAVAGKSVPELFFDDGEAAFRALERAAVVAALTGYRGVLALGGGAVLDPDTRADLRASGVPVVQLSVGLTDAAARVGLARDRPVLALNPRAQLHRLLGERAPLYDEVATGRIDTDSRPAEAIAADVLALLAAAGRP